MGLAYNTYLNSSKVYGCKTCKAHLANHEDIISRVGLFSSLPSFPRRRSASPVSVHIVVSSLQSTGDALPLVFGAIRVC